MTISSPQDPDARKLSIQDGKQAERYASQFDQYPPGSVELSAPLETSVPLEAPRFVYGIPLPQPLASEPMDSEALDPIPEPTSKPDLEDLVSSSTELQSNASTPISAEETFQLLAERLVVDLHRRKVGEIVVRKEVETRIVEVPIRREKLIVEQVSPEYKQLAIVDLGQAQDTDINSFEAVEVNLRPVVSGKFNSPESAMRFLEAIANQLTSSQQEVQITVVSKDSSSQATFERLLEQHSSKSTL